MRKIKTQVKIGNRKLNLVCENFTSVGELYRICKNRPTNDRSYDYFNGSYFDAHWSGFENFAAVERAINFGIEGADDMIKELHRYAHQAVVADRDKLSRRVMTVCGGGVSVPDFLSGSPECMVGIERKKVKSRIIKIGVDTEIAGGVSADSYAHAGALLVKLICKLELAGYRIKLVAADFYTDDKKTVFVMTNMLKRENEPLNYRRMLFPMTKSGYSRVIGFDWVNTVPEHIGHEVGYVVSRMFDDSDEGEGMDTLLSTACGEEGYTLFQVHKIVDMVYHIGDEETLKRLESRLVTC